ncbi:MAG: pantoate--beta-alanine ligase [Gammaproteobacteria bacterium SG8_11]|nr:MAG: pantoate--beta-alanine ligase [Gammaproteobacteria bacterium SG8_11]
MFEITDIASLQNQVRHWKAQQQRLAFVPTMGNLHQGHLQLIQQAKSYGDKVIVSIFVNPLQFPPGTDFEQYPRTLTEDTKKLEALGIDVLFAPEMEDVYPQDLEKTTKVAVPELSDILCGLFRPGHFVGVTTIVAKLFNLVQPDIAVFGEKDYQQLLIIKKMVADLGFPVEIQSAPTVRESDGLAMSSRNQYLTEKERETAPLLYQTLLSAKQQIRSGTTVAEIESNAMQALKQAGFKPDYVSIRKAQSLEPVTDVDAPLVILAAAWLGKARLIDNITV